MHHQTLEQVLKSLEAEKQKLEQAIDAIRVLQNGSEGTVDIRSTDAAPSKKGRRKFTTKQRAAMSRRMSELWKKRKAAAKKRP